MAMGISATKEKMADAALRCVMTAPLGRPVVPLVWPIVNGASGSTSSRSSPPPATTSS
ncbi:MAG: hypothetical protein M5U14_09930 [Acidimicrobiia bacterium]|nr:hypothetical protein [Acidimicrobiia bacterium]